MSNGDSLNCKPESTRGLVRGLVLLNCAGGMNNKAIVDDWRIKLILPLLWFFDFLLNQRPIASALFDRVKQRYPPLLDALFLILCNLKIEVNQYLLTNQGDS